MRGMQLKKQNKNKQKSLWDKCINKRKYWANVKIKEGIRG